MPNLTAITSSGVPHHMETSLGPSEVPVLQATCCSIPRIDILEVPIFVTARIRASILFEVLSDKIIFPVGGSDGCRQKRNKPAFYFIARLFEPDLPVRISDHSGIAVNAHVIGQLNYCFHSYLASQIQGGKVYRTDKAGGKGDITVRHRIFFTEILRCPGLSAPASHGERTVAYLVEEILVEILDSRRISERLEARTGGTGCHGPIILCLIEIIATGQGQYVSGFYLNRDKSTI